MTSTSEFDDALLERYRVQGLITDVPVTEFLGEVRAAHSATPSNRGPRMPGDIDREFNTDKWGSLLAQLQALENPSIGEADQLYFGHEVGVGSIGHNIFSGASIHLHEMYCQVLLQAIRSLWTGEALVEFGAGYGSIALRFADDAPAGTRITALELTAAGKDCLRLLAGARKDFAVGSCDFLLGGITDKALPEGALFVTVMSMMYLPCVSPRIIRDFIALKPARVAHFEPTPQETQTPLTSARNEYMRRNRYNADLWEVLDELESRGELQIVARERCVAGENALLPVSMIAWQPT